MWVYWAEKVCQDGHAHSRTKFMLRFGGTRSQRMPAAKALFVLVVEQQDHEMLVHVLKLILVVDGLKELVPVLVED